MDRLYGRNLTLQTLDGALCHNGEYEQRVFELRVFLLLMSSIKRSRIAASLAAPLSAIFVP